MRGREIKESCEAIETFLLLKRQNLVIYSWMEMKKRDRRLLHPSGSRVKTYFNGPSSLKNSSIKLKNQENIQQHFLPVKSQHNSPIKGRDYRLATEHYIREENAESESGRLKDSRQNLTDREAGPRRQVLRTENEEMYLEDNDEFEDIVMERLTKLQENINKLMKEKRVKEEVIGYGGQNHFKGAHQNQRSRFKSSNQQSSNIKNNLLHRKKAFFEFLNSQQQNHKDTVYNLKYIPFQDHKNADIQKIRQILHSNKEEENLIDNVDYFFENNVRKENNVKKWDYNYRIYQNSKKEAFHALEIEKERSNGRGSNTLYMHRYHPHPQPHTTRSNRIHYVPNNLDIQTVIEPRGSRFPRNEANASPNKISQELASNRSNNSSARNNLSSFY